MSATHPSSTHQNVVTGMSERHHGIVLVRNDATGAAASASAETCSTRSAGRSGARSERPVRVRMIAAAMNSTAWISTSRAE